MKPQIVFVDSPQAYGKDYFIENFKIQLGLARPNINVRSLRATDIAVGEKNISEWRKYTQYQTEEQKKHSIFLGHMRLLATLNKILKEKYSETDVVIVNRSFLTFLVYNIQPAFKQIDERSLQYGQLMDQATEFLDTYVAVFSGLFFETPTLMVRLGLPGTDDEIMTTVKQRVGKRQDDKPVDEDWIKYLIAAYKSPNPNLMRCFTYQDVCESGDAQYIIDKYF